MSDVFASRRKCALRTALGIPFGRRGFIPRRRALAKVRVGLGALLRRHLQDATHPGVNGPRAVELPISLSKLGTEMFRLLSLARVRQGREIKKKKHVYPL